MKFQITIDYIGWNVKPNPNYVLTQPIIHDDGIHRWTRVVELVTYDVDADGNIQVPEREYTMFSNWTGMKRFHISEPCECPSQVVP